MMERRLEGGLELTQGPKSGTAEQPLITIITSTFNAEKELSWTINSIRGQTYPYIQWIIADGGSTDGTIQLLKENEDIIDYWFSEKDNGIFDAWNKALKYVNGSWIQFIGASDELYSNDTLKKISVVLASAYPNHEMVYGNIVLIDESRKFLSNIATPWPKMIGRWQGLRPMLPVHPEVFHHKSVFEHLGDFNTTYRASADTELMYKSMSKKAPYYVDLPIDKMVVGGISTNPKLADVIYRELVMMNKNNNISPPFHVRVLAYFKMIIKSKLSKLFPFIVNERFIARAKFFLGKK